MNVVTGGYVVSETGGPAGYTISFSGACDSSGTITSTIYPDGGFGGLTFQLGSLNAANFNANGSSVGTFTLGSSIRLSWQNNLSVRAGAVDAAIWRVAPSMLGVTNILVGSSFSSPTLMTTNGSVGISTATPRHPLEVAGIVSITNTGGGLKIGAGNATLTNMLYASATLAFPITIAGAMNDLPIATVGTITNRATCTLGVPWQSAQNGGSFGAFLSNDTVYVRFINQTALAITPPSGAFSVQVNLFQ